MPSLRAGKVVVWVGLAPGLQGSAILPLAPLLRGGFLFGGGVHRGKKNQGVFLVVTPPEKTGPYFFGGGAA